MTISKATQLLAAIMLAVSLSALSLGATVTADSCTAALPEALVYVPDQVVFKLVCPEGKSGDKFIQPQQLLQQVAQRHRFDRTVRVFAHSLEGPLNHVYLARLSAGISPIEACKKLKSDPAIKWAEPDYYYRCQLTPDDTYYSSTGS